MSTKDSREIPRHSNGAPAVDEYNRPLNDKGHRIYVTQEELLREILAEVKAIRETLAPLAELLPSFLPGLRARAKLSNGLRRVSGGAS